MKPYKIAVPIVLLSVITGFSAGIWYNSDSSLPSLKKSQKADSIDNKNETIGRPGSAHEHALFHVVVNSSEKDFTSEKFQLNSRYVHLEGNKSDIVHKHAKGITWKMFLQTVNISTSTNNSQQCIKIYGNKTCGNGSLVLNGDFNASLDQEISQGDNLLIIIDTEEWRSISKKYMQRQLPEAFRPEKRRGRSI